MPRPCRYQAFSWPQRRHENPCGQRCSKSAWRQSSSVGYISMKSISVFGCRTIFASLWVAAQEATGGTGRKGMVMLFESASDAVFVVAVDTSQIIDANSMASALYGYDHDEMVTKKITDLSAEPEATQRRAHEAQTKPGQVLTIPLRLHRKRDGTVFPVEITARSITWGKQPVLLIACRDITERRQAEEEIRRMALAVDTAPNSITVHDFDGRFLYANRRTFELHGYSREEFLALDLRQLDVPVAEGLVAARMQELRECGEASFEAAHLLLGLLALGQVGGNAEDSFLAAPRGDFGAHVHGQGRAIFAEVRRFEGCFAALAQFLHSRGDQPFGDRHIKLPQVKRQELLPAVAVQLKGPLVGVEEAPVEVMHGNRVGGGVHRQRHPADFLLGLPALGDVAASNEEEIRRMALA